MNTHEILTMLAYPRALDMPETKMELYNLLLKVYTLLGAVRNRAQKDLEIELEIMSQQLYADLNRIPILKNLRFPELSYIFNLGSAGELGDIKGVNYSTFINWLKIYAISEERKSAFQQLEIEKNRKQLSQNTAITERESEELVKRHINNTYAEFLDDPESVKVKLPVGGIKLPSKLSFQIKGSFAQQPGEITDFGGVKNRFLTAHGLKRQEESLLDFFTRMKLENKTKLF